MSDSSDGNGVVIFLVILFLPVIIIIGLLSFAGYVIYKGCKEWAEIKAEETAKAAREAAFRASATFPQPERSIWVPATGNEVFTPDKLLAGQVYRITVNGKLYAPGGQAVADALYKKDNFGNLAGDHDGFCLDGKPVGEWDHHRIEHDRADNRYVFDVDGTGAKLSLALVCPVGDAQGGVFVNVEPLPEPVSSPAKEERKAEQRAARLQRDAEQQARSAEVQEKIAGLLLLAHALRNWADPAFQKSVGQAHTAQLLARRDQIIKAYVALHQQDPEVIEILQEQHPKAYDALVGELAAYQAAERHEVKGGLARPQRKLTTEEFRDRIVRRELTAAEDERAVLDAAAEAYEKKAATLRDRGLDEDEIAQVLGQKSEVLEEAQDRLAARKRGNNVALAKLA